MLDALVLDVAAGVAEIDGEAPAVGDALALADGEGAGVAVAIAAGAQGVEGCASSV